MALLDLLTKQGSVLKKDSSKYTGQSKLASLLPKSTLDLDGKKPSTYKDKAPEGQSGRI